MVTSILPSRNQSYLDKFQDFIVSRPYADDVRSTFFFFNSIWKWTLTRYRTNLRMWSRSWRSDSIINSSATSSTSFQTPTLLSFTLRQVHHLHLPSIIINLLLLDLGVSLWSVSRSQDEDVPGSARYDSRPPSPLHSRLCSLSDPHATTRHLPI